MSNIPNSAAPLDPGLPATLLRTSWIVIWSVFGALAVLPIIGSLIAMGPEPV